VSYYEVNEDTQKVAKLDEWVASQEPTGAIGADHGPRLNTRYRL
jgi:hypothetical protein